MKRQASRRNKLKDSTASPAKRAKSIFGRKKRRSTAGSGHGSVEDEGDGEEAARDELQKRMTQVNAAAEAEESARRQEKQDGSGWRSKFRKDRLPKPRRTVYVNVDGPLSDPRGYERNKVRTSKYTLVTFLPKVSLTRQSTKIRSR